MSIKHFNDYYNQICNQYFELQQTLQDLSEEVATGMIEPDRITQLKQTILPIENSYRTLSYIKYLLNMPNKKQKRHRYESQNKNLKLQAKDRTKEDLINKNKEILRDLHL